MFERIKQIIIAPKNEWAKIAGENSPHSKVFSGYVLPLSLITVIAAFIGYGLIGFSVLGMHFHSISWGIRQAIVQWVIMVGGIYLTALVINLLAETFGAKKNFDRAFSLVAYAYTPMLIAGIFYILPALSFLVWIGGLYSLYLLYLGIQPMMETPAEKHTGYFVVSLIVTIVVTGVLSAVLTAIFISSGALGALKMM
ncbi:MAG: YIP1 family protein [Paludibacter sp.]|nr:YIP1 family protein [Paludibacter sp.]